MKAVKSMLDSVRVRIAVGALAVGLISFFSGAATGFSLRPAQSHNAEATSVAMDAMSLTECRAGSLATGAFANQTRAHDASSARATLDAEADDLETAEPSDATTSEWAEASPAGSSRWLVQVGAFSSDENAHALASRLEQKGYEPLIVAARGRTGEWLQHVRIDFEADEASVVARAREFEEREGLPVVVVAIGPDGERLR